MALFGDLNLIKPKAIKFDRKKEDQPKPKLRDMAEKMFGEDKELMSEIYKYLGMCREKRLMPSRISWEAQLNTLAKFPEDVRKQQIERSIMYGYRSMVYEENLKKYSVMRKEKEENIRYDLAF